MRAIILAAGQGLILDSMIKCLIRHPADGKTILEHALRAFAGMDVTIVVGYRAVEIIQRFPHLHYVFNEDWAVTNSAYSLGLALDDTPAIIASSDLLFSPELVTAMLNAPANVALTSPRENRGLTAIHCITEEERIVEIYTGPLRDMQHDELLGLYKIVSPELLKQWKARSLRHSNLFNGQTLPVSGNDEPISRMRLPDGQQWFEINTVIDYLHLVETVA